MISQLSHTLILLIAIIIFAVTPADSEPVSRLINHHPGGAATSEIIEPDTAFSRPVATLPSSALPHFTAGATLFYTRWVARPAKRPALEGLGPLFNALSCEQCHRNDGRGRPPKDNLTEAEVTGTVVKFPLGSQNYGLQLQDRAVRGLKPEGQLQRRILSKEEFYADGQKVVLFYPSWAITSFEIAPPPQSYSVRTAPAIFGLGLLEAIPEQRLHSLADPDDKNNDGISGRLGIGRFGWRAKQTSLLQQTAHALINDMGISSDLYPSAFGDCTINQKKCHMLAGTGLEADTKFLQTVTDYVANLGPPPRSGEPENFKAGQSLFHSLNCHGCHTPSHKTGEHRLTWLSGHKIWPYTDLLLHDMGDGLADGGGREWRTPPLWGLGRNKAVNGNSFYLHDGRALTLEQAVLWHGGEAESSRENFKKLSASERTALIDFLESL